jgi:hypothetical protein
MADDPDPSVSRTPEERASDFDSKQKLPDPFKTPAELVQDFDAKRKLEDALRDAWPSILKENKPLFGGPPARIARTEDEPRRTDFPLGSIQRQPRQPFFPEETPTTATTTVSGGGKSSVIATEFVDAPNFGTDFDEILYSHEIGKKRLVKNGDCIRARYAVRINPPSGNVDVIVRFGAGNAGDFIVADGQGLILTEQTNINIDVLIMRSGNTAARDSCSILGSVGYYSTQFARCSTGGVSSDFLISSFDDNLVISLWGGVFGAGAAPGQVTARLALIEYVAA